MCAPSDQQGKQGKNGLVEADAAPKSLARAVAACVSRIFQYVCERIQLSAVAEGAGWDMGVSNKPVPPVEPEVALVSNFEVGLRVLLVTARANGGACKGVSFLNYRGNIGVCYDDKSWACHPIGDISKHAKPLCETHYEDEECSRIQCALLGKHQQILVPSGFLLGARPDHSVNGRETFRAYYPPPVAVTLGSTAESRYAEVSLFSKVRTNDPNKVLANAVVN
eukprot:5854224-Pleurochrysis_carterae.AAC.1